MKVYIVFNIVRFEWGEIEKIFSTFSKAYEFIENYSIGFPEDNEEARKWLHITEMEIE